jgi:amino acid permease
MKKMTDVVDYATFLVALIYVAVGLFGYLAFTSSVSGDVLTNFGDSLLAVVMKCGEF